jgi:hypothetical protein
MAHSRGLRDGAKYQLVNLTQRDIAQLKDALQFIKDSSSKENHIGRNDRKVASETIMVLDKKGTDWDSESQYKQFAFKPNQLKLIADIRDTYKMDLSPQIGEWQVPGAGDQRSKKK